MYGGGEEATGFLLRNSGGVGEEEGPLEGRERRFKGEGEAEGGGALDPG